MNRKIIGGVIILSGLVLSLVIIGSGDDTQDSSLSFENLRENTSSFFDFSSDNQQAGSVLNINNSNNNGGDGLDEEDNLTTLFSKLYASQNFSVEDGELSNQNTDPRQIEESLRKEMEQSFDEKEFSEKDIIVSNDSSQEAQALYIETIDRLLREDFEEFNQQGKDIRVVIKELFEENNTESVNYLKKRIPVFVNHLLETEVPEPMIDTHLKLMNLWQNKLKMYKAISSFQDDPLKAYVALQEVTEIIQRDIELQQKIIQKYNNLTE